MISAARSKPARSNELGIAAVLAAMTCALSYPFALLLLKDGFVASDATANGYFVTMGLFVAQDMYVGPLTAAMIVLAWVLARRPAPELAIHVSGLIPIIALTAGALSIFLRFVAHHNYPLSLDEFMPTFQAEIFRNGLLMAPLSDQALEINANLQPFFTYVDEERQLWAQHYRPVHAAILAIFPAGYDQAIAHAVLTLITVLAIADIARTVFPDRKSAPVLAALFLVLSPQVLLTSASGFAFTTHLAFNTVWLALFLRGSWRAHFAATIVGFFALGIHQVHVHAIFVFPFGIAMLFGHFGSRWKALPYVAAYSVGVPLWIMWPEIATWLQTGDYSALPQHWREIDYISNYFAFSDKVGPVDREFSAVFLVTNVLRFLLWLSPIVVVLLFASIAEIRRLKTVPVICLVGIVFTIATTHVLMTNQMHTLGTRYYHPALPGVIVVCLATYYAIDSNPRLQQMTITLLAASAILLLPWRAWQVHQKVAPRATVQARLEAIDAESVLVRAQGAWFMPDFVRNDPFLSRAPVIYLDRGEGAPLLSEGPTVVVDGTKLRADGFPFGTLLEPNLLDPL